MDSFLDRSVCNTVPFEVAREQSTNSLKDSSASCQLQSRVSQASLLANTLEGRSLHTLLNNALVSKNGRVTVTTTAINGVIRPLRGL